MRRSLGSALIHNRQTPAGGLSPVPLLLCQHHLYHQFDHSAIPPALNVPPYRHRTHTATERVTPSCTLRAMHCHFPSASSSRKESLKSSASSPSLSSFRPENPRPHTVIPSIPPSSARISSLSPSVLTLVIPRRTAIQPPPFSDGIPRVGDTEDPRTQMILPPHEAAKRERMKEAKAMQRRTYEHSVNDALARALESDKLLARDYLEVARAQMKKDANEGPTKPSDANSASSADTTKKTTTSSTDEPEQRRFARLKDYLNSEMKPKTQYELDQRFLRLMNLDRYVYNAKTQRIERKVTVNDILRMTGHKKSSFVDDVEMLTKDIDPSPPIEGPPVPVSTTTRSISLADVKKLNLPSASKDEDDNVYGYTYTLSDVEQLKQIPASGGGGTIDNDDSTSPISISSEDNGDEKQVAETAAQDAVGHPAPPLPPAVPKRTWKEELMLYLAPAKKSHNSWFYRTIGWTVAIVVVLIFYFYDEFREYQLDHQLMKIETALQEERLQYVYAEANKIIAQNPRCFQAYYYKGVTDLILNRYLEALHSLQEVVENPATPPPLVASSLVYSGYAFLRVGKFEESAAVFEEALRRNPFSVPGWKGYAEVLRALPGRGEDALSALDRAIELDPSDMSLKEEKGWLLTKELGRPQDAIALARELVETAPFEAAYHRLLLASLSRARDVENALRAGAKAAELFPEDADVNYEMAAVHLLAKDHVSALDAFERAAYLRPASHEYSGVYTRMRQVLADKNAPPPPAAPTYSLVPEDQS